MGEKCGEKRDSDQFLRFTNELNQCYGEFFHEYNCVGYDIFRKAKLRISREMAFYLYGERTELGRFMRKRVVSGWNRGEARKQEQACGRKEPHPAGCSTWNDNDDDSDDEL